MIEVGKTQEKKLILLQHFPLLYKVVYKMQKNC